MTGKTSTIRPAEVSWSNPALGTCWLDDLICLDPPARPCGGPHRCGIGERKDLRTFAGHSVRSWALELPESHFPPSAAVTPGPGGQKRPYRPAPWG